MKKGFIEIKIILPLYFRNNLKKFGYIPQRRDPVHTRIDEEESRQVFIKEIPVTPDTRVQPLVVDEYNYLNDHIKDVFPKPAKIVFNSLYGPEVCFNKRLVGYFDCLSIKATIWSK